MYLTLRKDIHYIPERRMLRYGKTYITFRKDVPYRGKKIGEK